MRHPNPVRDILVEFSPKDLSEIMERPFCSLTKSKRVTPMSFTSRDGSVIVRVIGNQEYGIANIWDHDVLIYLVSRIVAQNDPSSNSPVDGLVRCTPTEILKGIHRGVSGRDYLQLKASLLRLKNTTIETTIRAPGGKTQFATFNWLTDWSGWGQSSDQLSTLDIVVSRWLLDGIHQKKILTIDPEYFDMSRGLARAVYRVARKHAGSNPDGFTIRLSVLREKVGSDLDPARFARVMRALAQEERGNVLPRYAMHITHTKNNEDAVHFVDRAFEDAKTAERRRAKAVRMAEEDARAAWIDANLHPRDFPEAFEQWCESGADPADFRFNMHRPRLL